MRTGTSTLRLLRVSNHDRCLQTSASDTATPKKLYPQKVSFWPVPMRFERIGCYDATARIGEGNMGQVYRGEGSLPAGHRVVCPI